LPPAGAAEGRALDGTSGRGGFVGISLQCVHIRGTLKRMKVAGVRQFRKEVSGLVKGGKLVIVTWHGRPRSVLMPLKDIEKLPRELRMEFLRQSGREIQDRLRRLGVTEGKILSDFAAWRRTRRAAGRRR